MPRACVTARTIGSRSSPHEAPGNPVGRSSSGVRRSRDQAYCPVGAVSAERRLADHRVPKKSRYASARRAGCSKAMLWPVSLITTLRTSVAT